VVCSPRIWPSREKKEIRARATRLSNDSGGYGTGIAFGVFDPQASNNYQNSWMAALPQAGVLGQTGVNYALVLTGGEAVVAAAVVATPIVAPAIKTANLVATAGAEVYVGLDNLIQFTKGLTSIVPPGNLPGVIGGEVRWWIKQGLGLN
jgi:hypothetical protein